MANLSPLLMESFRFETRLAASLSFLELDCDAMLVYPQSLNRHLSNIRESGTGSVPDLARQLTSKRISVRKQMDPYEVSFVYCIVLSIGNHMISNAI